MARILYIYIHTCVYTHTHLRSTARNQQEATSFMPQLQGASRIACQNFLLGMSLLSDGPDAGVIRIVQIVVLLQCWLNGKCGIPA